MSEDELQAIEARCAAASPEPWALWDKRGQPTRDRLRDPDTSDTSKWTGPLVPESMQGVIIGGTNRVGTDYADSVFIAHARTDLPAAVSELRRLRAQVEELEQELGRRKAIDQKRTSKGGRARADALTPARRSAIAQQAVQARWARVRTDGATGQGE